MFTRDTSDQTRTKNDCLWNHLCIVHRFDSPGSSGFSSDRSHNYWCLPQRRTDERCHRLIQIFMNLSVFVVFTLKAWTVEIRSKKKSCFLLLETCQEKKRCSSTLMSMLHHNWCCSINTDGWRAGEGGFSGCLLRSRIDDGEDFMESWVCDETMLF